MKAHFHKKRLLCPEPLLSRAEKMRERKGRAVKGLWQTPPGAETTRNDWQSSGLTVSQPWMVMRSFPYHPETGIWGCRHLTFLSLSFWGTRLPFWFSLSIALNSVTDITVVSQDIAYVCVYAMSGSSGRQPGILFLNFGSCCTAPHIMAPLLKAG